MRRVKIGDIYSIKLPNNEYAFLRVFQDKVIGAYKYRGKSPEDVPTVNEYEFYVYIYNTVFKKLMFIENRPFQNEQESCAPPFCWIDQTTGKNYSIYDRGERRFCTYDECKDLEILAVWDDLHITDRLMGNHKWENLFKRPVPPDD